MNEMDEIIREAEVKDLKSLVRDLWIIIAVLVVLLGGLIVYVSAGGG